MKQLTILIGFLALMLAGCADEKFAATPDPSSEDEERNYYDDLYDNGGFNPRGSGSGTGTGSGPDGSAGSAAGSFDIKGSGVAQEAENLSDYTGRAMNAPKDAQVIFNLEQPSGSKGYGGSIRIGYYDDEGFGDEYFEGEFRAAVSKGAVKYNRWIEKNGQVVWHGFFQDECRQATYNYFTGQYERPYPCGAIVVVVDENKNLGDGAEGTFGGSVWYKNFKPVAGPHPPTHCWFVSVGPYDCRAWKSGDDVNTRKAINPDSGYTKLGRFTGLSVKAAFGKNFNEILANDVF